MRCILVTLATLCFAVAVRGQDMPLSQILIDGEHWRRAPGTEEGTKWSLSGLTGEYADPITALASRESGDVVYVATDSIHYVKLNKRIALGKGDMTGITAIHCEREATELCCHPKRRAILRKKVELKVVVRDLAAHDCAVTKDGAIYCTVPEEKAVYRCDVKGKVVAHKGAVQFVRVTLRADDGALVVAPKEGKHLWAYRIKKDGTLTDGDAYYALRTKSGKESTSIGGMTMDASGRLYVATGEGVQVFDPTGRLSGVLVMPRNAAPTHVVFGGKNLDELYVACGKKLYVRKTAAKRAHR